MTTTLIQRGKIEDRDFKRGIDSIVKLDYMGAAEYEFGAIPESLACIRECVNDYTYLDIPIKDKVITVFCKNDQKTDVKAYLNGLASNKMRTKLGSYFDMYINPSERFSTLSAEFWWDIENNLMFWKKDAEFEAKFKKIIVIKPV